MFIYTSEKNRVNWQAIKKQLEQHTHRPKLKLEPTAVSRRTKGERNHEINVWVQCTQIIWVGAQLQFKMRKLAKITWKSLRSSLKNLTIEGTLKQSCMKMVHMGLPFRFTICIRNMYFPKRFFRFSVVKWHFFRLLHWCKQEKEAEKEPVWCDSIVTLCSKLYLFLCELFRSQQIFRVIERNSKKMWMN